MLTSQDLSFFSAVARARSLAAAARELDVTPPAVSQRLQGLEARLGVRLVNRAGRRLTLTAEGTLLAEQGSDVLERMEGISASLLQRRNTVSGRLHVAAPFGFGRAHVAPAMAEMRRRFRRSSSR